MKSWINIDLPWSPSFQGSHEGRLMADLDNWVCDTISDAACNRGINPQCDWPKYEEFYDAHPLSKGADIWLAAAKESYQKSFRFHPLCRPGVMLEVAINGILETFIIGTVLRAGTIKPDDIHGSPEQIPTGCTVIRALDLLTGME